jgi:hypothetical protein
MISEREKYEQFENYLKGLLDNESKAAFEDKLRKDPELNRELEEYRQAHRLIFEGGLLDLRQELETLHEAKLNTGRSWRRVKSILISSGILVTGALLYVYLSRHDKIDAERSLSVESGTKVENTTEPYGEESRQILSPESSDRNALLRNEATDSTGQKGSDLTVKSPVTGTDKIKNRPMEAITNPLKTNNTGDEISPLVLQKADTPFSQESRPPGSEIKGRPPVPDCERVIISCEFIAENTCSDKSLGRILFLTQSLRGGMPPYEFSITSGKVFESRVLFDNLKGGNYRLAVRDANQCISETGFAEVRSLECDFRFAPGLGELWEIPFITDKEGKLNLYSKDGKLLYSAMIGPYASKTWDGRSLQGEVLPLGVYMFLLDFKDGSLYQGTVTIIK